MNEIDKLRQRLKNVSKNAVQYRMTIDEANALVKEFDELSKKLNARPQPLPQSSLPQPQVLPPQEGPIVVRSWDGGTF